MESMNGKLLDSVIIIDHLNGISSATKFILGLDPRLTFVSVITRAEILSGIRGEHRTDVKAFLDQFQLLVIDGTIADLTADLRSEFRWKLPDAFQAALALRNGLKLVTRNTKDFRPENHSFVEIPYRL
jgi:hypothetical protein